MPAVAKRDDNVIMNPSIQGWRRWTLVGLLALVSLNALAAGYGLMAEPDGSALGIPLAWLENSPFTPSRLRCRSRSS